VRRNGSGSYDKRLTFHAKRRYLLVMARTTVLIACFEGAELLDIAGPTGVFSTASTLLGRGRGYDVRLVAQSAGPVVTSSGVTLLAQQALGSIRGAIDTLIVPGGLRDAVDGAASLVPIVHRLAARTRRLASVCSGAFILSRAGLLDGRAAVTHWAACEQLRRQHPQCRVEDDRIFVRDGHIWTSAGVSTGIDLALAMVEEDHGAQLALEIARWLVVYLRRPGGQSQFSAPLAAQMAERQGLRDLLLWMADHIDTDLSVAALAARANMSARTFARVFAAETNFTPAVYVERLRVDAARRSLETTKKSVKQIARTCGFGTVETLHRAFKRGVGSTPLQYRARFATPGLSG
jgi:transcriptional regulator GlxA family with amidase domain